MTQTQSVQRAIKHLEGLRGDLKIRLEEYDRKIREAETMNLRQEHIDKIRAERRNIERLYEAAIDRAKIAVQEAQVAEERRQAVEAE